MQQRNSIVRDIHTEFRALNIEIPTLVEKNTTDFVNLLEGMSGDEDDDDASEERTEDA